MFKRRGFLVLVFLVLFVGFAAAWCCFGVGGCCNVFFV